MPTSPYFINGSLVPSVSTILDYSKDKSNIIVWAKRKKDYDEKHGEGAWEKMCNKARDRGTALHAMALETCIFNGVDPRDVYCSEELKPYWEGNANNGLKYWVLNLMKQDYEVVACEQPFVHKELYYGGTPDLVIKINGQTWVWDLKTYKGYTSYYAVPKYKLEKIQDKYGIKELDKSQTYQWYNSKVFWSEERQAWIDPYECNQYKMYRRAKRNEKKPRFKGWDWYSDKLNRAFKQCILYRELLQHNGIPIHNLKVVSASLKAGVKEFIFFDSTLTNNMDNLIQLYQDAKAEAIGQVEEYHRSESILNLDNVA